MTGDGPAQAGRELLRRILQPDPPAFALLHRDRPGSAGEVEIMTGEVSTLTSLADLPTAADPAGATGARHETLALIPYRQVGERGFDCVDDGAALRTLQIREQGSLPLPEVLWRIPDIPIAVSGGDLDVDDDTYARTVRAVRDREIARGEGANFVIQRSYRATITGYRAGAGLALFRRLLTGELAAYWTFLISTGDRTLVGASPERHLSVQDGVATMNPISGTYRYPRSGPRLDELITFLGNEKETDELYMVVDEELKMMSRICTGRLRVIGPFLKEMARLAHTEYLIEGRTTRDVPDLLRQTMFAPTVTGSPLENACRVITRYEPAGRGYYSGVAALVGRDATGARTLDSAILIRTADIDHTGALRLGVGSTLVRHSDPESEAAETRAKAASLLAALQPAARTRFHEHPLVRQALRRRNDSLAGLWLRPEPDEPLAVPALAGHRVLVVDAEDHFTAMIGQLLDSLGLTVTVRRFDAPYQVDEYDLTVLGPGPGDPCDDTDPRVAHLAAASHRLLHDGRPFLAVCLSHQVLSRVLGLRVARRAVPNQGVQREIDLFGRPARLGFYNSFAAYSGRDVHGSGGTAVAVAREPATGEVYALRGGHFGSVQFHAESVLSPDGVTVIRDLLRDLLPARAALSH